MHHGADIDHRDLIGHTPIMVIASLLRGPEVDCTILQYMLKKGADPNAADRYGRSAMHYAAHDIHKITLPHRYGTSLHSRDWEVLTPLHDAAASSLGTDMVRYLLRYSADINAVSDAGATPLHCAFAPVVVRSLLRRSASIEARDQQGRTPLLVQCLGHLPCMISRTRGNGLKSKRIVCAGCLNGVQTRPCLIMMV